MGEGAFSQGPMVPLLETRDPLQVRMVLDSLDDAGIPALTTDMVPGLMLGPVPPGVSVVVVPREMVDAARSALERRGLRPAVAAALPVPTSVIPLASSSATIANPIGGQTRIPRLPAPTSTLEVEDEEAPLEGPPFEGASAQVRLAVALAGCGLGALLQVVHLAQGGFERVRALALSWDGFRFSGNVVAAGFVHGSTLHFLGNLAFGLLLGFVLLGTHGIGATAAVWLCASMLGIAAEAYLSPGASVLGASAGIYGLVGLWLHGEWARAGQAVLPRRARLRALGVIVLLAPGAMTPVTSSGSRVAVLAHLVGFAVGLIAGTIFSRRIGPEDVHRHQARGRWAFGVSAAVAFVGLAASFLAVD